MNLRSPGMNMHKSEFAPADRKALRTPMVAGALAKQQQAAAAVDIKTCGIRWFRFANKWDRQWRLVAL